ncbi:NAD(P)/FAD-dependent oxidoreductase [Pectobacterium sp. CFBP8739]|uniref:NAD(P)/FAD-dependent oxidoreductase n=1 Tax=Pectobacterium TaxID=122277 RepID=UPI0021044BD0|nr:NAD(P)/FAD-dependent oxidoreductase [Pectobacterium sp. CFBP8739]
MNQVRLFHDWTDRLTVFGNGHDITPDIRADLAARHVPLVDGRITEITRHGSHSATIKIDTSPDVAVDILFAHPRTRPSASLHDALGLATVNTPTGIVLKTDERRETSIPGIYAAGDLANPGIPSVTTAIWQGAMAGISAQQSMLS